jgi:hypothetical protein
MSLSLDSAVPPEVARHIGDTIGARASRWVDLVSS